MKFKSYTSLSFLVLLGYFGHAFGGNMSAESDAPSEGDVAVSEDVIAGNFDAGEERYKKSCINCHGAAGKGVASYPKISGNEISFTKSRLEDYREGKKIGPNSSLMIMMAKPLTDEDIANLAVYLKDAES